MQCQKGFRDYSFSRTIVDCALAVYIENGSSIKNQLQCLDLSSDRQKGSTWSNTHGSLVNIVGSKANTNGCDHNNHQNAPEPNNYTLIENADFNFIYVECTTEGSSYFDCVFRKIARNGLFALSTSDDPALYGRPPEPALRCYSGRIMRTFYAPEMAVRLILTAMARSAARFSKSIEVLLCVAIKSTVTILVKVKKGAESAVKCLNNVKRLVHCTVCEERAFLPHNDGYVIDNVCKYLCCECSGQSVGRTIMELGPMWAGPIGSASFVTSLLPHVSHSLQLTTFLHDLIAELRCDSRITQTTKEIINLEQESSGNNPSEDANEDKTIKASNLVVDSVHSFKRKAKFDQCEIKRKLNKLENVGPEPAPPFYYNLHKHKPKGAQKLLKVDKIIELLQRRGFKASRTHFDRAAVKTDSTLRELHSVISEVS